MELPQNNKIEKWEEEYDTLIKKVITDVTDKVFIDEYGYYEDWHNDVRELTENPIKQFISQTLQAEKEKWIEKIENLAGEHRVGDNGIPYWSAKNGQYSDALADIINLLNSNE